MVSVSSVVDTKFSEPPQWATLQRELLAKQTDACVEFFEHYFDTETGYGKWIPRWGGNDGPDDAAENGLNWTMLFALGAPPVILELWKKGYEGHIAQYTEAKTVEVPMAREGMYYRDFSVMFDFFHHTESLSAFTLSGYTTPPHRAAPRHLTSFRPTPHPAGAPPHVTSFRRHSGPATG